MHWSLNVSMLLSRRHGELPRWLRDSDQGQTLFIVIPQKRETNMYHWFEKLMFTWFCIWKLLLGVTIYDIYSKVYTCIHSLPMISSVMIQHKKLAWFTACLPCMDTSHVAAEILWILGPDFIWGWRSRPTGSCRGASRWPSRLLGSPSCAKTGLVAGFVASWVRQTNLQENFFFGASH